MKYLPYEDFHIITPLKPAEVQALLAKETEPVKQFSFSTLFSRSSGYYFSGYVVNGMFEISRVIDYRNSFLPQIKGSTEAWLNGSRLHITMQLHPAVMAFMFIWMGGVGLAAVAVISAGFSERSFEPLSLIPLAMFLFGYLLSTGGFKYESRKAKAKLIDLLSGHIEQ